MAKKRSSKVRKITLIASAEKTPKIKLRAGARLDVRVVSIVNGALGKPKKMGARLCGGTSTCLALFDVEGPLSDPSK